MVVLRRITVRISFASKSHNDDDDVVETAIHTLGELMSTDEEVWLTLGALLLLVLASSPMIIVPAEACNFSLICKLNELECP